MSVLQPGAPVLIGIDLARGDDETAVFAVLDEKVQLCDRALFERLSDLELACVYRSGPPHLHDAAYCELHLRQLTPWKISAFPALETL